MSRINRHQMFMLMAQAASQRATCFRRSVGAVLVQGSNVISIGYNGPPAGEAHCTGNSCGGEKGCIRSIHAEKNAIERATSSTQGSRLYVTESPCPHCAELIIEAGIKEVFYLNEYRLTDPIKFLSLCGIKVRRMTPSGYIIDYATNELLSGG